MMGKRGYRNREGKIIGRALESEKYLGKNIKFYRHWIGRTSYGRVPSERCGAYVDDELIATGITTLKH